MPIKFSAQVIGLIVLVAMVALIVFAGPAACNKIRSLGAQNRVNQEQLNASGQSGKDAVETVGNAAARERSSDDLSRSNEEEIRNAQGSDAPVNPAARDAGLRSLCQRSAYRDSERCKLLHTHPE